MTKRTYRLLASLALAILVFLSQEAIFASSQKRSKADKDISAIGHREIAAQKFWLPEKEKERGKAWSAEFEKSVRLVTDTAITGYLARVAQNAARNSDVDMAIEVRVLDDDKVDACTLTGGYLYLTTGLLARLESESELASVLARGIAHTALRSLGKVITHGILLDGPSQTAFREAAFFCLSQPDSLLLLSVRRADELDADYFGIQYLYKAGYDEESFVRLLQSVWGARRAVPASSLVFNPYPPLPVRLKALRKEIAEILPRRDTAVVSTSEFEDFQTYLHERKAEESIGHKQTVPTLVRHDIAPQ